MSTEIEFAGSSVEKSGGGGGGKVRSIFHKWIKDLGGEEFEEFKKEVKLAKE